MSFNNFQNAVNNQFNRLINQSTELFYVDMDRDELFNHYLASFPEGTDPIFRERSEHDCNFCKNFIRRAGHIVAIVDGQLETIWDIKLYDFYQVVANALSEMVKFRSIAGIYRHTFKTLGGNPNRETQEDGIINIFEHLYFILPSRFVSAEISRFNGNSQTNKELLERSLNEISLEASEIVIDLIEQNSLYRGQEHLRTVKSFLTIKREFDLLSKTDDINTFLWVTSSNLRESGRFKNTVIGTLLHDLSIGIPLEEAVGKFETKVAPTNYKRSTALITQAMIDRAQEKLVELGIEDSLARRFATAKDLTINNVLFADQSIKKKMKKEVKKGILANLEPTKPTIPNVDKLKKVTIDEFVTNFLPHTTSIEIMVENSHINNLMSVIAPTNSKSPNIMKWSNPYSWSYNGEVTDSIRERVKRAGGDVEGFMRCSLSWHNFDDLDIHAIEPSGDHVFYGNKRSPTAELDVDMNAGSGTTREPVENITWKTRDHLQEGTYKFYVHNYRKRELENDGFQVEMELDGKMYLFTYDQQVRDHENIVVIEFNYSHQTGISVIHSLPTHDISKDIWNIATQNWTKVSMILNSPNFWNGEKIGNKHWFFILDGCLNPDKARGFYNEFLMNELTDHRKVFEVLSSKMKTEYSDRQLSGVGFSSTQPNHLLCKIGGKYDRIIKIVFGNENRRFKTPENKMKELVYTKVGFCEVCKKEVTNAESRLSCPNRCENIFHTAHFLESVRITGHCPVCRSSVTKIQINKAVQTIV